MTDDEYLSLVYKKRDSPNLKQKALSKIGLDDDELQEIPPIRFEGFTFKNAWSKRKANGNWVSSAYQVSWLNSNYVGECGLKNVILLEEAHVLLDSNAGQGDANPSAIAQGLVKRMLAEIRSCVRFSLAGLDIDTTKYDAIDESQMELIARTRGFQGDKACLDIRGNNWGRVQGVDVLKDLANNPGAGGVAAAGAGMGIVKTQPLHITGKAESVICT